MKAILSTEYGTPDTLRLEEVPTPAPKAGEVLVKIHAASVNAADLEILRGDWFTRFTGPRRPKHKIPGSDLAGRVEAIGAGVTQFEPGDEVWGDLSFPYSYGTFAEYVSVSEKALAPKPASMSFEEASTYPQAAIIPLQSFRDKGKVQPGHKLLINGAGGGMGTFGVQIAKYLGAEVTAVDRGSKLGKLRSLGADHVLDYTQIDYTRTGEQYDLVIDVVARRSVFDYRRTLKPDGIFMFVGGSLTTLLQIVSLGTLISMRGSKKIGINAYDAGNRDDLATLGNLFESGDVVPVIDRSYSLEETPDAMQYLKEGSHLGKLVITMQANGDS